MVGKSAKVIINFAYCILQLLKASERKLIFTFILLINLCASIFANENLSSAYSPILLGESEMSFTLNAIDFSWIDINAEYQASHILMQNAELLKKAATEKTLQPSAALWSVLQFENKGKSDLRKHIELNYFADEIIIFFVKDGEIFHKFRSGKSLSPPQKPFHSTNNYIPININAGKIVTIIIRQSVIQQRDISALTSLEVYPSSKLNNQRLITFSIQAFYLGLLLVISLTGLVKSFFYRKRLYTYFALFILFLGLYFPYFYGLLDDLLLYVLHNPYVEIGEVIFTGIVLFGFLFFSKFYELKTNSPHHYWTYLAITFFSEISAHLMMLFKPDFEFIFQIRYFLAFLWLSATIYLTIRQIFKDKNKRYLLLSLILSMSLGFFVMVISIFDPNFYDYYLFTGFQIGAFLFSTILFYDLFKWEKSALAESDNPINTTIVSNNGIVANSLQNSSVNGVENEIEALLETAKPAEKVLLEKLCQTIEVHIENPMFSVEMLAQEVGYSRVHLNRKLKAISNLSTNKFILLYRLNVAYKMLESGAYNVNEVAYKTGYSSTSYFVKCFGDKYGTTPGMLLKE